MQSAGGPAPVKLVELKSSSASGSWMPMNNVYDPAFHLDGSC